VYVGLFKEERRGIGRVLEICVCVGSPKMPRKNWGEEGGAQEDTKTKRQKKREKKKKKTCSREKEKEKAKMVRGLQEAAKKKKR